MPLVAAAAACRSAGPTAADDTLPILPAGLAQASLLRPVPAQQQQQPQRQLQAPSVQQDVRQRQRQRLRCTRLQAAADEAGQAPTSSSELGVQQAAGGLQARLAALGAFLDALYR